MFHKKDSNRPSTPPSPEPIVRPATGTLVKHSELPCLVDKRVLLEWKRILEEKKQAFELSEKELCAAIVEKPVNGEQIEEKSIAI